jgi:hypothetical protein
MKKIRGREKATHAATAVDDKVAVDVFYNFRANPLRTLTHERERVFDVRIWCGDLFISEEKALNLAHIYEFYMSQSCGRTLSTVYLTT